ncbi:hypothetical protein [Kluyvera georgiana]|uniref:hypothetical protein n=1 Tax=Kluyvera georgiana TaxID=73098 RepID=UPI003AF00482
MSGLQAWNANGVIVADLGDYNMRYMGSTSINVAAGQTAWTVGWGGMSQTGWIVVLNTSQYWNNYYAIPDNGFFTVRYLPTSGTYADTLYFEIYKWGN